MEHEVMRCGGEGTYNFETMRKRYFALITHQRTGSFGLTELSGKFFNRAVLAT